MAETTTIEIEVPTAMAERLAELARASERTTAEVARQALDQLLEVDAWHQKAIAEAIAELDAGGPVIAHEDMMAYLDALSRGEKDPPKPPTVVLARE